MSCRSAVLLGRTKLRTVPERITAAHGSQCGFCTPDIVMSMYTLLRYNPWPGMEDIEMTETYFQVGLCFVIYIPRSWLATFSGIQRRYPDEAISRVMHNDVTLTGDAGAQVLLFGGGESTFSPLNLPLPTFGQQIADNYPQMRSIPTSNVNSSPHHKQTNSHETSNNPF